MRRLEDLVEALEFETGTPYVKKLRCRLCGDIIFSVQDKCPKSEISAEMTRLAAHLSIQHQIQVEYHACDDPNCLD